jgi:hypothetical protein
MFLQLETYNFKLDEYEIQMVLNVSNPAMEISNKNIDKATCR